MRPFVDVTSGISDPHLRRAAELAWRARGATAPNPLVGCVVVRNGKVVGEGYHPRAGEPHAEVFALAAAGEHARGSHVYVTLEPCSHHGRTPPCADALIAAGVARVTVGMADPSEQAGGGAERLLAAGIAVDFAEDPEPFQALNRGWLKRTSARRPFVTVKVGLSLDARIAFAIGERATITGPSGALVTRELRERADAIMVGTATVNADDPALTVRDTEGGLAERQPLRVVLARGSLPRLDSRIFTDGNAPALVLAPADRDSGGTEADHETSRVLAASGVNVQRYDADRGLLGALEALGNHGVNDVLVEPGQRLLTSLWRAGLIDELVTVTAGGMAGVSAPTLFAGDADTEDGQQLSRLFSAVEAGIVGDVSVTVWRPRADER